MKLYKIKNGLKGASKVSDQFLIIYLGFIFIMRSKSKTMTEFSIDYGKCKFECQVTKKKFLGLSKRFLYIFEQQIIINKVMCMCMRC